MDNSNKIGDNHSIDNLYGYDDEDDDEKEVRGCFTFRSKTNHNNNNDGGGGGAAAAQSSTTSNPSNKSKIKKFAGQKKHSLDSTIPDTKNPINKQIVQHEFNLDDATYDRVFYRGIQKSLDQLFSRDDTNTVTIIATYG